MWPHPWSAQGRGGCAQGQGRKRGLTQVGIVAAAELASPAKAEVEGLLIRAP